MKEPLIIYYNPRCGKCRTAKTELVGKSHTCNIVEYLHTPLLAKQISEILKKLGKKPLDIIRQKEPVFIEKYAGNKLTDAQWIQAIVENPILMQRPIVVQGNKAWIARSEDVLREI